MHRIEWFKRYEISCDIPHPSTFEKEENMSARIPALLQRAARIRQQAESEIRNGSASWLRIMRLRRLSLLLDQRLREAVKRLAGSSHRLELVPAFASRQNYKLGRLA
jgi:hypothetical protein